MNTQREQQQRPQRITLLHPSGGGEVHVSEEEASVIPVTPVSPPRERGKVRAELFQRLGVNGVESALVI